VGVERVHTLPNLQACEELRVQAGALGLPWCWCLYLDGQKLAMARESLVRPIEVSDVTETHTDHLDFYGADTT
jgi:hypothetical protein